MRIGRKVSSHYIPGFIQIYSFATGGSEAHGGSHDQIWIINPKYRISVRLQRPEVPFGGV
jgi:hypothetical protein